MQTKGAKLKEDILNRQSLVTVSFKCNPITKFKLIQECKKYEITLSEHVASIIEFYDTTEDITNKFNEKFIRFLDLISDYNIDKKAKFAKQWQTL